MAGKILIVDDISTNRIVLKVKLAAACYDTYQAGTGGDALVLARDLRPDLILLDVDLPDMDGIEVCTRLKADPLTRPIPVVMVTAHRDDMARIRALRAGAEDVFWKPYSDMVLLARLRSVLRAHEAEAELGLRHATYRDFGFAEAPGGFQGQALVALVAGQAETALAWKRGLSAAMSDRIVITEPERAMQWDDGAPAPDVFVVAADLAEPGEGLRLMSELRSRHMTRYSAVCIVLPPERDDVSAMALDLGASDLIEAGADPQEMALRIRAQIGRKRQADRLRASVADGLRLAMTDPLTGLHNRRYALPHLGRIAASARSSGRQYAVMLLDLDRFKQVNDTWGHAAGDAVLTEVAGRFRQNLRGVDLIARIGGEEFLVALPDTTLDAARRTAERLRRIIEERPFRLPSGTTIPITLSIGLAIGGSAGSAEGDATAGPDAPGAALAPESEVEKLMALADEALLGSKADGRNQVTVGRSAA